MSAEPSGAASAVERARLGSKPRSDPRAPDAVGASASDERVPHARRGHWRLIAFFLGLALAASIAGVAALGRARSDRERAAVLIATVAAVNAIGFAGVLFHRLKTIRWRWRETEAYLARIRRESAKYRALLEGAADMLVLLDGADELVREQNAAARETLAIAGSPSAPAKLSDAIAEPDLERLRDGLRRARELPGGPVSIGELRVRTRQGALLAVDARVAGIELEDSRAVLVALRDLTAQKEMERRLQIHERLSSLGLLTAGVAHEINNPLEGIGNYLALLERDSTTREQRARYLESVKHGFARIREIAKDLLTFTRRSQSSGSSAELIGVVDRALKLLRLSDRVRGVEIAVDARRSPLMVVGDAARLEQVVINLVLNAATASGAHGHVWVTADELDDARVVLRVEDDGPGIAADDLERIFDPLFSSTGGSGLGLAISYGIVSAHGGRLSARNRDQGGACFTVELPSARAQRSPSATKTA